VNLPLLHRLAAALVVAAATAVTLSLTAPAAGGRTLDQDRLEEPLLAEINEVRREHGLHELRLSTPLSEAADAHARAMGRVGFFGHDSAGGDVFWERVRQRYGSDGHWRWAVGENLLWRANGTTPEQVVELWLDSPPHRRVLLSPKWREVGLAAVRVRNAPGVFEGNDVTIVAADFGVRE